MFTKQQVSFVAQETVLPYIFFFFFPLFFGNIDSSLMQVGFKLQTFCYIAKIFYCSTKTITMLYNKEVRKKQVERN